MSATALIAGLAVAFAAHGLAETVASLHARRAAHGPGPLGRVGTLLTMMGRALGAPVAPDRLAGAIDAAGLPGRADPADVMAAKVGACVVAACVLPIVAGVSRTTLLPAAAAAAGGFFGPDLWLRRRAARRAHVAALELPAVLDLVRVALEAGLPARRALAAVAERGGGLVCAELRELSARTELGEPPAAALRRLERRLPTPQVAVFVAALTRAETHGAPLAPSLLALAAEVRSARAIGLQRRAAQVVPQMQLVIALLLVPAVLAAVAAVAITRIG